MSPTPTNDFKLIQIDYRIVSKSLSLRAAGISVEAVLNAINPVHCTMLRNLLISETIPLALLVKLCYKLL